jgi:hypothetical protein
MLMLLLAWSLIAGDLECMWAYVLTASLVAQTHLVYLVLTVALTALVGALGMVRWYRKRGALWPIPGWRQHDPQRSRSGRTATIVFALCWMPVLVETLLFHPNNITQLFRYFMAGQTGDPLGLPSALKLVVGQLAPIPGGFSPLPLDDVGRLLHGSLSKPAWLVGLVLLFILALSSIPRTRLQHRTRRIWVHWEASFVALYSLAATCVTAANIRGVFSPRWYIIVVWPVVAFAWAVLAWYLIGMAEERFRVLANGSPVAGVTVFQPQFVGAMLLVASVVACFSPVGINWVDVDRATAAASAVLREVDSAGNAKQPVSIESGGFVAYASLTPAIAYRLRLQGHPVYWTVLWPYRQDDDFHKLEFAPTSATHVLLREKSGGVWRGPAPAPGAKPIVTLMLPDSGVIEIFVESNPARSGS